MIGSPMTMHDTCHIDLQPQGNIITEYNFLLLLFLLLLFVVISIKEIL